MHRFLCTVSVHGHDDGWAAERVLRDRLLVGSYPGRDLFKLATALAEARRAMRIDNLALDLPHCVQGGQ